MPHTIPSGRVTWRTAALVLAAVLSTVSSAVGQVPGLSGTLVVTNKQPSTATIVLIRIPADRVASLDHVHWLGNIADSGDSSRR